MKRIVCTLAAPLLLASCAQHSQTAALKTPPTPSAPSAMDRQILNAVDAGDGDAELRLLRARVIDSPASVSARLELGRAYEQRGYPELALDHYRWAVEHSPESADAQLVLARALDHTGHSADAIATLSGFLEAHPQPSPTPYSWLGIMRDDAGDWKASEQAYRDAMARSALDHDYLHNNLGYSLLNQGQSERAAAEFRAALKLNPHSEIARANLGIALSNDPKEAILNLQSLNEPAVAHSNLAAVLIEQGKYAEARKELQIALQYNQANPAALKNLELLSNLDGKPVTIPAATLSNANPTARWSRVKSTVRRWLGGESRTGVQEQVQTAAQQKSESKQ
jgi:tetratricopeptide (TPR) repeat protein